MFFGISDKDYIKWQHSVKSEVKALALSPDQWLELLEHRTVGQALDLVKDAGSLVGEFTMDKIVAAIWKELDRLYLPKMKRSDDILNDLMHGPVVHRNNFKTLEEFSNKCYLMNILSESDYELKIIASRPSTMTGLVRRLDDTLQDLWLYEERENKAK